MRSVLPATVAELRELQAARGRLLVLRRRVVPLLALAALQCNNFAHLFILTDFTAFYLLKLRTTGPDAVRPCL
jgi:hypothetical protein